ncbi:MAG TPA: RlmE family RNA methyltransferase [Alphaproteobacteria bacterium]
MTNEKTPGSGPGLSRTKRNVVKNKKLTPRSKDWLNRQINDPFVQQARAEGWRARAVYKLTQIDDKLKFLTPGKIVVDLGAAPGSWTELAVQRIQSLQGKGKIIALDILEMQPINGAIVIQKDFTEEDAPEMLFGLLEGKKADVVLSDMAANTTGHRHTDHLRVTYLVELAWDFAKQVLAPNGVFVSKVFQGGTEAELLKDLKKYFTKVQHIKPLASRKESPEVYLVATGFKGLSNE